jgi:hypothetical protein
MIRRFFAGREDAPAAGGAERPASRRVRRRWPALEALESRALLSFAGPEQQVSHNPEASDNFQSANASSSNGTSVAVWINAFSAVDHDIWAQRFDRNGRPTGEPISVDFSTANSYLPRVAVDSQGRFVVTWQDVNPDGTTIIMMRYFDASGTPRNGITQVITAGSTGFQPDVAASDGSFVITWVDQFSATDHDIWAERFVITAGAPQAQSFFAVNVDTNEEFAARVAMAPDGRFDIVYERQFGGDDWDIFASQYDAGGNLVRSLIPINFDSRGEFGPIVSMDNAGNAVVVYERFNGSDLGIDANRLSSAGVVGHMITVRDAVGLGEFNPSVALAPTGGRFVVSYDTDSGFGVSEVASNNAVVATFGPIAGFGASISIDGFGRYVVTYTRSNPATGHEDIFGRRGFLT